MEQQTYRVNTQCTSKEIDALVCFSKMQEKHAPAECLPIQQKVTDIVANINDYCMVYNCNETGKVIEHSKAYDASYAAFRDLDSDNVRLDTIANAKTMDGKAGWRYCKLSDLVNNNCHDLDSICNVFAALFRLVSKLSK